MESASETEKTHKDKKHEDTNGHTDEGSSEKTEKEEKLIHENKHENEVLRTPRLDLKKKDETNGHTDELEETNDGKKEKRDKKEKKKKKDADPSLGDSTNKGENPPKSPRLKHSKDVEIEPLVKYNSSAWLTFLRSALQRPQ